MITWSLAYILHEIARYPYLALWDMVEKTGLTTYLDQEISTVAHTLRRIREQQWRLRALLEEAPQPRLPGRN